MVRGWTVRRRAASRVTLVPVEDPAHSDTCGRSPAQSAPRTSYGRGTRLPRPYDVRQDRSRRAASISGQCATRVARWLVRGRTATSTSANPASRSAAASAPERSSSSPNHARTGHAHLGRTVLPRAGQERGVAEVAVGHGQRLAHRRRDRGGAECRDEGGVGRRQHPQPPAGEPLVVRVVGVDARPPGEELRRHLGDQRLDRLGPRARRLGRHQPERGDPRRVPGGARDGVRRLPPTWRAPRTARARARWRPRRGRRRRCRGCSRARWSRRSRGG